ncbi:hypothetical protein LIER_20954 [Lithospermum erythrorhizon]|uniref:Transposase-associated domain-containing protein n=1 Tax=Lithospermum erythrorhizon TaxID=34254 RepID=A0AAV3QSH7_LITER
MAKIWIDLDDRASIVYMSGVNAFLDFVFAEKVEGSKIYYPCSKCHNRFTKTRHEVRIHCLRDGFLKIYKNWRFHGEPFESLSESNVTDLELGNDMGDII